MATVNAIVINSLLTKECAVFSNVSFFGVHLKTDRFQNELFSNLCIFVSVSEKAPFSQRSNVNAR